MADPRRPGRAGCRHAAVFSNHGKPRRILFNVVRERKGWAVDEVRSMRGPEWEKPAWTISKILTGAPDAFARP
jgi:hypothetical protein